MKQLKETIENLQMRSVDNSRAEREVQTEAHDAWRLANKLVHSYGSPSSDLGKYIVEQTTPAVTYEVDGKPLALRLIGGNAMIGETDFRYIHCMLSYDGASQEIFSLMELGVATLPGEVAAKSAVDIDPMKTVLSFMEGAYDLLENQG